MIKNLIILGFCLSLLACQSSDQSATLETADVELVNDTLVVQANSSTDLALKHYTIDQQKATHSQEFTARIQPITGQHAIIHPPFSGRIHQMHVQLGQKVKKGQVLFTMQVQEIFELQEQFRTAEKEWALAKIQFDRQEQLFEHGILSQQEFEDARQSYDILKESYDQVVATLKLWNLQPKDIKIGNALPIVAPISGTILKNNIAMGAWVQELEEAEMVIGNTQELWATLLLKPQETKGLQKNQKVKIWDEISSSWVEGKIHFISTFVDPEHKHIEVFIHVNNREENFRLGTITKVSIEHDSSEIGWVIPAKAVMQKESSFVFVKVDAHRYIQKAVKVSSLNKDQVLVTAGIEEGDQILSAGGIYLLEYL